MKEITKLLDELNELCKLYVLNKEDFNQEDRIRELVSEIIENGFDFEIFKIGMNTTEYKLLSDMGKRNLKKINDITKLKLEAIHNQQYEQAARLRDDERKLTEQINTEFYNITNTRYYFLKDKSSNIVFFLDPERQLKGNKRFE